MIHVSFCCNNPENGQPIGRCCAVQLDAFNGSDTIEFESPDFGFEGAGNVLKQVEKPKDSAYRCDGGFKLGRRVFACAGWKCWVGNWCWDGTRMTGVDVLNLVWHMQKLKYRCVNGPDEFFDLFNAGGNITKEIMQESLR